MNAYVVLPKDFDVVALSGEVDLSKYDFVLYASIDDALKGQTNFNPNTHYIGHIEFTDYREVLEAIRSTYAKISKKTFRVRLIETIVFHPNEGNRYSGFSKTPYVR